MSFISSLPYTEACIRDVLRLSALVPWGIGFMVSENIQIEDYDLPKGTTVYVARKLLHKDPRYWKNPNEFYPEHFLDSEGRLLETQHDGFFPFSVGKNN